jgi:hypothetical protein
MALAAFGREDADYYTHTTHSLYDKPIHKVSRSSFTYCTFPNTAGVFMFNHTNQSEMDMIGDCYLHFRDVDRDAGMPLESCTFEYKSLHDKEWCLLEKLEAKTLEMFAAMKPGAFKERREGSSNMMIPLPFFFTHTTMDYFPLIANTLFRIRYVGKGHPDLVCRCVYLDSCERANKVTQITTSYRKPYVFSRIQEAFVQGPDASIRLEFSHLVKDIQVIVERVSDPVRVIVPAIKLLLNGHTHYDLNCMMTTDIIPAKSYDIIPAKNKECINYLPFCLNPASQQYTSSINFSMLDYASLILKDLKAGEKYKVTIMARYYNSVVFTSDEIALHYQ